MRPRMSLYQKILVWFFVNVVVLIAVLLVFFNLQLRPSPDSSWLGDAGMRLEAVARLLTQEVQEKNRAERDAILRRYSDAYGVTFVIAANTGEILGGPEIQLPQTVRDRIGRTGPPGQQPLGRLEDEPRPGPRGAPSLPGPPPDGRRALRPPPPPFLMVSTNPLRYWAGIRIPVTEPGLPVPIRSTLLAYSDSISGLGLFFDPRPWAFMIGVGLFLSILLWFPFVRSITRAISAITTATEHIAEERFDIQVDATRGDELGRLGRAINHLAKRLSGFVGGQKRFLGDISHELNSPLGRMRVALAILEERVPPEHRAYVADIQEEVNFMSNLVGELLAYSKAGLKTSAVTLQPVMLDRLVRDTIQRECGETAEVAIDIPEELSVLAHPELLSRAVANVVRNAVRYAGSAGLISIAAVRVEGKIRLAVRDAGPGVPEKELGKLFDPFYRIDRDRSRETGGTGLGLAIVKTCVEACDGTVSAANLTPTGFEVAIVLNAAN